MPAPGYYARYAALIEQLALRALPAGDWRSADLIQVERSAIFPSILVKKPQIDWIDPILASTPASDTAISDAAAHRREFYLPVLIYACLRSFQQLYETLPRPDFGKWEQGLRPWCDLLESKLGEMNFSGGFSGDAGNHVASSAWTALALHTAGNVYLRDAWKDLASDFFGKLARFQRANGPFLLASSSDNPETLWYHELIILHAAASYAVQAEDRSLAKSVQNATKYHLAETQPDHATSDPWAVFPFIWNPQTHIVADQLLHTAQTQQSGLAAFLLADALLCLRLFL